MKKTLFNIPWEVVYRTPEFGEIIGLGRFIRKGKIQTKALSKTEALPEIKALLKQIEKGASDEAIQDIMLKGNDLLDAAQKKAQAIGQNPPIPPFADQTLDEGFVQGEAA